MKVTFNDQDPPYSREKNKSWILTEELGIQQEYIKNCPPEAPFTLESVTIETYVKFPLF